MVARVDQNWSLDTARVAIINQNNGVRILSGPLAATSLEFVRELEEQELMLDYIQTGREKVELALD